MWSGDCVLSWHSFLSNYKFNNKNKCITNVRLPHNKVQKDLQLLNISPIRILQRTKLVKNIILRNFSYVTFSQKVNIKRDIKNFLFWAPIKHPFLTKILKIHIAYALSQNKPVLHIEFHGNRLGRSQVMPVQTDRQKIIIPKM